MISCSKISVKFLLTVFHYYLIDVYESVIT